MDSFESLVVGEKDCSFKDIVDVFFNPLNSVAVFRNWTDFAREVDIEPYLIEEWIRDILTKALTVKDVLHNILASWKSEKGKEATLQKLLKHLEKVELKNVADDLRQLFSTENRLHKGAGQLFLSTLPEKSKYYIPRTFVTRRVIDAKVFSSTHKDVFVLHEIDRHQLSQLAKRELTDTSTSQVGKPKLSVRFILLENFADWTLLCGKTTNPIHLIRHHEGRFHWICTNGDISALQKATDEKNQDVLSEAEFIQEVEAEDQFQPNQPICISDSPGMGKSLLLASIGRQLQQRYPQRCIAFMVISEFVVKIRELLPKCSSTKNAVVETLLQEFCKNAYAREQLVQKMTTPTENPCTQVELMFDGFDEVSAENVELANECLATLKTNFSGATRVWVTTRPQHLQTLEKHFSVMGYKIQAFQDKDQIQFLTSFWKSHGTNLDEDKLKSFSKTCLSTLKKKLNKKDEDIAGIPLQCMMIAEVYMQNAHRFSDSKNKSFKHSPESTSVVINSIADLYQKMIKHKIEKFKNTCAGVTENTNCIWRRHMYLALELIFPSHAHKFKDTLEIESELKPDYLLNVGILERTGSTAEEPARFVHRTLAEYLAAHYFVTYEIINSTADVNNFTRGLPDFLFAHVFKVVKGKVCGMFVEVNYSFEHSVVCYFIDALLGAQTDMSTENGMNQSSTSCIKDVIYACIYSDFGHIIKFLHSLKYPERFSIKYILYSDSVIFILATRTTSLDMLKFLLESFEHKPLTEITHYLWGTALHTAAKRGSYTVFEYILKEHHFEDLVKEDTKFLSLMHFAVFDTVNDDLNKIQDRIQIVKTLCKLNSEMLNYKKDSAPFFFDEVNIKLLKTLIDCGANLFHQDGRKNTYLHGATSYLSPTDCYELFQFIPKTTLNSLLQMCNRNGDTILNSYLKFGRATPDIVQLILSNGVDINASDNKGLTCVFSALYINNKDMTIPTLKLLLENGADHTRVDSKGDSILHWSTTNGRIDCLQFFLEEKNMNVNQINEDGNTPIFYALSNDDSEMVEFLIERGADYKILTKNRNNVIHSSARLNRMECLQLFLTLSGIDINEGNDDGETPLLCALTTYHENTVKMIRLLLGKGADHKISDKQGNSILHLAAASANAECFSHFAGLPSVDVNARNRDNDTPLHLATKKSYNYGYLKDDLNSFLIIIEALVSLGADVNANNNDGKTPFQIYQEEKLEGIYKEKLLRNDLQIRKLLQGSEQENHLESD